MSGFIPMVSTTPPPIEDDDFGDFIDSTQQDDFGDFSSPVEHDDYSYPSLNSPPDITNSMGFPSEGEVSPTEGNFETEEMKQDNDKEVEEIVRNSKIANSKKTGDPNMFQSVTEVEKPNDQYTPNCNGIEEADATLAKDANSLSSSSPQNSKGSDDEDSLDCQDKVNHSNTASKDCVEPVEISANSITFHPSPDPDNQHCGGEIEDSDTREVSPDNSELEKVFEPVEIGAKSVTFNRSPDLDNQQLEDEIENLDTRELSPGYSKEKYDFGNFETSKVQSDAEVQHLETTLTFRTGNSVEMDDFGSFKTSEMQSDAPKQYSQTQTSDAMYSQSNKVEGREFVETNCLPNIGDETPRNNLEYISIGLQNSEFIEQTINEDNAGSSEIQSMTSDPNSSSFDSANENIDTHDTPKEGCEGESNNVDFADFGSSQPDGSQEFEADVADFQSVPDKVTTPAKNSEPEEFGAFETVSLPKTGSIEGAQNGDFECDFAAFESHTADNGNDGFADFPTTSTSVIITDNKNDHESEFGEFSTNAADDDFADFDSVTKTDTAWPSISNTVIRKPSLNDRVANYISKYSKREDDVDLTDGRIPPLDEHLEADVFSKESATQSPSSVESAGIVWSGELWDQLEDIDNTIALNFIWNGSGHNKHLLDSLGMHTQNILFSGAKQAYYVPTYYAAGLGLIDPNKGVLKPMSAAEKITAISPTDKNTPTTKDELDPEEPHPEWKTISDEHGSGESMIVDGSWSRDDQVTSNSAFANTIHTGDHHIISNDPVPIISSTMDLDYFDNLPHVGKGVKTSRNADLIDPELLELTSAPSTEPPVPPKDAGSATLSRILASIKSTNTSQSLSNTSINTTQDNSKWKEEENKLSPDARSVLQRLPDLSYMRAKVLMFPINMSRVNISEDV